MPQLYQLSEAYAQAVDLYNEAETDEQQQTALDLLRQIEEPFEDKIDSICKIVKSIEAEQRSYEEEINRLAAHARSAENRKKNLKEYLKGCILSAGLPKPKVETKLFKTWVQANGGLPSITVSCPVDDLPKEFKILVPAHYELDSKAIAEAFKNGEVLPETITCERGTHVRIS